MQYIVLIHKNTDSDPTPDEWDEFIAIATQTGMFKGGSAIGLRYVVGEKNIIDTTAHVDGFMRFDSDDLNLLLELLKKHPVVRHGGTVELCEMPKS